MKFSIKDFSSQSDQIAGNCGFGHIYWRNLQWKTSFFCAAQKKKLSLVANQEGETTSWWNSKISKINCYLIRDNHKKVNVKNKQLKLNNC